MKNLLWMIIFGVAGYFGYQELLTYQKKIEVQSVYIILDDLYKAQQAQYFKDGNYIKTLNEVGIPNVTDAGYRIVMKVASDGRSYSATATNGVKTFVINSDGDFKELATQSRFPSTE